MKNYLTTNQVAQALGVSDASLKRWCDKGLIGSVRTGGGHRRLPLSGVLEFLRERGYPVLRPELLGLPSHTGQGSMAHDRAADQMRLALEKGDEDQFRQVGYNLYLGGTSMLNICDKLLAPVFRQLGELWYSGEIQVYQERRACEICLRWLHEMRYVLPHAMPTAPFAMGGTLARDPYQLANMMVELVLQECGWRVESVGGNLPGETMARAVADRKPRLVWISASYVEYEPDFIQGFREVFTSVQHQAAALVVGGRALNADLRHQLQYHAYGDNLQHLVDFVQTITVD